MTINAFTNQAESEGPMASVLLDCFCDTCGRQITLDELQSDFHKEHRFMAIELAALQAMRAYLSHCGMGATKQEFPHS
jgi:hypothetical protein